MLHTMLRERIVYTKFQAALDTITTPRVRDVSHFLAVLQRKLEEEKSVYPPINLTLLDPGVEEESS